MKVNENIDYFSQETILDYIDGRLAKRETLMFEQQLKQDETLALAVEGIKGFYIQEQQNRSYLENLMAESEISLKNTLANVGSKTVALASRRRGIVGISIAACIALLMVFTLPHLLNNVDKNTQATQSVATNPSQPKEETLKPVTSDRKSTVAAKDLEQGAELPDQDHTSGVNDKARLFEKSIALDKRDHQKRGKYETKNTDGSPTTETNAKDITNALLNKSHNQEEVIRNKQIKQIFPRKTTLDPILQPLPKKATRSMKNRKVEAKFFKRAEVELSKKNKAHDYANGRGINATPRPKNEKESKSPVYRTPGKLHLWVFTDNEDQNYLQLLATGRQVANKTQLQLLTKTISTQKFNTKQWKRLIKKQKPKTNDVVWVHYLGKPISINKPVSRHQKKRFYSQLPNKGQSSYQLIDQLNKTLNNSKAALKIVTIDNGEQVMNTYNLGDVHLKDDDQVIPVQSKVQTMKIATDNAYKKLFLGNTGNITILSNQPGQTGYQGIFTNNLLQGLNNASVSHQPGIDWATLLEKVKTATQKQSKKLGKPQMPQRRTMKVKKNY